MKAPPEADPKFWIDAKCVRVHVTYTLSGVARRRFVVVSGAGAITQITDTAHQNGISIAMQSYALALARVRRKRGATEAMKAVLPHVARVDQQAAALLPAAEQRGMDVFRRRKTRDTARTNARRRERTLDEIRRNADLLSEDEVVTAWREGVVDGVHSL